MQPKSALNVACRTIHGYLAHGLSFHGNSNDKRNPDKRLKGAGRSTHHPALLPSQSQAFQLPQQLEKTLTRRQLQPKIFSDRLPDISQRVPRTQINASTRPLSKN